MRQTKSSLLKIVSIYAAATVLWIVSSDLVVSELGDRSRADLLVHIGKGLVYTLVSSSFLYLLIQRVVAAKTRALNAAEEATQTLKTEERRFHQLFESSPLPMWIYDETSLRFLAVNDAAIVHYGYSLQEFMAMTIKDIRPAEDVPGLLAQIDKLRGGQSYSGYWTHRVKDGRLIKVDIISHTLEYMGRPARFIVAVDITERNRIEQALIESMKKLEEKELSRTRFLAAAGHDLRQPVAAANLFVDALKLTSPTKRQSELIERLDQSMHIFSGLLERLLDISKLDSGVIKPQFNSFDLIEVFDWLERDFAQTARDKQLSFRVSYPVTKALKVHTDIDLLQSVLMNLVSNAIKFTEKGGILISARMRGNSVLLQVWDTGIGIGEEDMHHIFDEFYQVGNPQRSREGGLGLGLSICQRAMSLLGGEITCHSRPGHGSVFELRLPLSAGQSESGRLQSDVAQAESANENLFRGKQVSVVEDDALVAAGMVNLLQGLGAVVRHFHNAEEALRHDELGGIDYFIVDYALGGELSGLEFLKVVQQEQQRPIRAVILTGETSSQFIGSVADSTWPVLHKPVNYGKLAASLSSSGV